MRTAILLFTRDLRVADHPALSAAVAAAEQVVPLFVLDPAILRSAAPNRAAFLAEALVDLRRALEDRGGTLVIRSGDVVEETVRLARAVGAAAVYASDDVSGHARARWQRLQEALGRERVVLLLEPGTTVVPPGDLAPAGRDHYRVFTPYWDRWAAAARRDPLPPPARIALPPGIDAGPSSVAVGDTDARLSPHLERGGETAGRARLEAWSETMLAGYEASHDDLAADATSRLSPYLHLGCLSPLAVAHRVAGMPGATPFARQLCWRDFFHQLLAANPTLSRDDLRPRGWDWDDDPHALDAWRHGVTGYPIVDAGMRQLRQEGFMHNRARLVVASFLTKTLNLDWRSGAAHFSSLLLDGDVACNSGNWQWVAGTGADTRPNRIFNPTRQAERFDPDGRYVRRYVPELEGIDGGRVHEPWNLRLLRPRDYPDRIVVHEDAAAVFRLRVASKAGAGAR